MKNKKIRFYKVVAMCGHVGRRHYVPIPFAVKAHSAKEAARVTRVFPRVKHDRKDAILSVVEITPFEYHDLRERNRGDEYLNAQRRRDISDPVAFLDRVFSYDSFKKEEKEKRPLGEKFRRYKREYRTKGMGMMEAFVE